MATRIHTPAARRRQRRHVRGRLAPALKELARIDRGPVPANANLGLICTWSQRRTEAAMRAAGIPAVTPAHLQAKAEALRNAIEAVHGGAPDRLATASELLAWSLATDLLGGRSAHL